MTTPSPSDEPSLATLLKQLCARDEAAATDFDRLWRPRLVRFCAGYLKSRDETEDAVQDVIAKVLAVREQPDEPRVWLYRIARNHCLNLLRSRARRKDADRLATGAEPVFDRTGALTALVRADQQGLLERALAELPEQERELLRLRYSEELSREEIAQLCELDAAAVKSQLYHALQHLRQRLAAHETR